MSGKKVPLRKCIACGAQKSKKELVRIIHTPEDEILLDMTGRKNGRGAYICRSYDCLIKAEKTKALERSLKVPVPAQVYEGLKKELKAIE